MFARIFEAVGLHKNRPPVELAGVLEAIKPRELPSRVVSEGNSTHSHQFELASWDRNRLGPQHTDFDEDHHTAIEFPMCTYNDLYCCSCGREIIRSVRALI